jgi:hypothetical protein
MGTIVNRIQRKTIGFILCVSVVLAGTSCKKDSGSSSSGNNCVHCTAVCGGSVNSASSSKLDDCSDDWATQEATFKSSNAGCTINCDR